MSANEQPGQQQEAGYDQATPLASSPLELSERLFRLFFGRQARELEQLGAAQEREQHLAGIGELDQWLQPKPEQLSIEVQEADQEEALRLFPELAQPMGGTTTDRAT